MTLWTLWLTKWPHFQLYLIMSFHSLANLHPGPKALEGPGLYFSSKGIAYAGPSRSLQQPGSFRDVGITALFSVQQREMQKLSCPGDQHWNVWGFSRW